MNYCYGIVEDRNDPLKIGRVRVRVHGYDPYRKDKLATPDLPWSHVVMPATTAGLGGFGLQHSLVEGTTVFGFFRDDDMQDFVVMGVQQGIVQDVFMETVSDELLERRMDRGFADPRRGKPENYEGSLDGNDRKSASSSAGNTLTESFSALQFSCTTTASAPSGIGAPVKIRAASPAANELPICPAAIR